MAGQAGIDVASLVTRNEQTILPEWIELQKKAGTLHTGRISEGELQSQSRNFLHLLRDALAKGGSDASNAAYEPAKAMLAELSRSRALQGFSPTETATFVFSLKQPLFNALNRDKTLSAEQIAATVWAIDRAARRARPLHDRDLPEEPRGSDRPPAAGDRRAVDAGRQAVGRHPGAAADRHARQPAHPGGDGEPAADASSTSRPRSPSSTSPACRPSIRWSRSIC